MIFSLRSVVYLNFTGYQMKAYTNYFIYILINTNLTLTFLEN